MRLDNFIQTAMNNVLKNPLLSVLRDINFSSILKQSNFIKRDIGKSPYLTILNLLILALIKMTLCHFFSGKLLTKSLALCYTFSNKYPFRVCSLQTTYLER
uniref:Uncharacterized protein n=1 Tax=Aliarcobacter butzleri TaxID=28197 RepID=W0LW92_9BACT|nr:hypothetical protein [Aliarcobacter butzleri]